MIRIEGKDQLAILKTLEHAENYGARFVYIQASNNNAALKQDQLAFFSSKPEANRHQYEQRVLDKHGEVLPIIAIKNHLERRIDLENLTRSAGASIKDIYMDERQQAFVEKARVEITRETLAYELRQRGIKPDLKAFEQHLRNDDPTFAISGKKREENQEKPYLITITQNSDRLFKIEKIEPVRQAEQVKVLHIQSAALESTVRVEDAHNILHKLAAEKVRGNRFVSFPQKAEGLTEKDITASKTAFASLQVAAEHGTEKEKHLIKSIRVIEHELKPLVEKLQGKEAFHQKQAMRNRGQDLSM